MSVTNYFSSTRPSVEHNTVSHNSDQGSEEEEAQQDEDDESDDEEDEDVQAEDQDHASLSAPDFPERIEYELSTTLDSRLEHEDVGDMNKPSTSFNPGESLIFHQGLIF